MHVTEPERYEYRLFDLVPGVDDPETWATALAAEGWRIWCDTGAPVTINGRDVIRYYLRRVMP